MAGLTTSDVRSIAKLARLRLDEESLERMQVELAQILEYFAALEKVEVSDVEPTTHVLDITGGGRSDTPRPCLEREKAMEAAPDTAEGYFRVPRVMT